MTDWSAAGRRAGAGAGGRPRRPAHGIAMAGAAAAVLVAAVAVVAGGGRCPAALAAALDAPGGTAAPAAAEPGAGAGLPGIDPAFESEIRARYGDLVVRPADEDTAAALLAWGKEAFEEAEGMWARLRPPDSTATVEEDSTFVEDFMRGTALLRENARAGDADPETTIRRFSEARAAFEAVLEKDPYNDQAREYLVLCLERIAEAHESASLYAKAAELYANLIRYRDRANWYYHYRLMLVSDRLGRDYDALRSGYLAEDYLLQEAAGRLPGRGGTPADRETLLRARRTILEVRRAIQRRRGLYQAMLVTANRLAVLAPGSRSDLRRGELARALAWDPGGMGPEGFDRHLELLDAFNRKRYQEAYDGWEALRQSTRDPAAQVVVDYYLALLERGALGMGDRAIARLAGWWSRYRDRQAELAALGASYLAREDWPDGAYLLEEYGAACAERARDLMDSDRVGALAYFLRSSQVLWSRRSLAAYNASTLVPEEAAESLLFTARRLLLTDLSATPEKGAAPLAGRHRDELLELAPRIYEDLMVLARRRGRLSWIEPLSAEISEIRERGTAEPRFFPEPEEDSRDAR